MQRKTIKRKVTPLCWLIASQLAFVSAANANQTTDQIAPEHATGLEQKSLITAKNWMVSAANPHASQVGADILKQGGSAIDAMVAVQLVLGLVEPQSSGIGGGAFLVYWDEKNKRLTSYDGRETAPRDVTPTLFQNEKGEPLQFFDAVVGGRSVGTPGTIKLLWDTHQQYGKLDWKKIIEPAIHIAEHGFAISPRLAALIEKDQDRLARFPTTKAYFLHNDGSPKKAGETLKNPEYATTLQAIANQGEQAFYSGDIAKDIVKTVQTASNPGVLSLHDFDSYRTIERKPVCSEYQQFDVCGMGPPSSGALTLNQILSITSHFDLAKLGADNPQSWQIIGEASRLAFADRGRYIADSDFVPMPTEGLLDPDYLKQRAALIKPNQALTTVSAGEPPWSYAMTLADDESIELPSTSHFSIVDKEGNVVSITASIENAFGSRLMVRGFMLNNELTDFSFRTHNKGTPIANRIEPGKRPRSSMAPTIIMKDDEPYMAIGSPGGSRIIGYVAKTIIAHTQWDMDIQQAVNQPHLINRFGAFDVEAGTSAVNYQQPLEKMGYKVNVRDLNSGVHAIRITDDGLEGAADPRREGRAIGQ